MDQNYNNNLPYGQYDDIPMDDLTPVARNASPAGVASTVHPEAAAAASVALGSVPTSVSNTLQYSPSMFHQTNYLPAYRQGYANRNTLAANNFDNNNIVCNRPLHRQASSTGTNSPNSEPVTPTSASVSPAQQFPSTSVARNASPTEVHLTGNAVSAAAAAAAAALGSIPLSVPNALQYAPSVFHQANYLPAYANASNNINGFDNNTACNRSFHRQASSTGTPSPNSASTTPTSASVSPTQQFLSTSGNSPPITVPAGFSSSSYAHHQHAPLYSWALPPGYPSPYPAEYGFWSPYHQAWPNSSYRSLNFDEMPYHQTTLQRRPQRCMCQNCHREMNGLPPIVKPDDRGRKQHTCVYDNCNRHYSKASHLRTHLRWHTGERPYMCSVCSKRFSRSDELQRHTRVHTNYRPYKCPLCAKCFSRSDHLSKHKKTHDKLKKGKKSIAQSKKEQTNERPIELQPAEEQTQTSQNIKQELTDRLSAGIPNASVPIRNHAVGTSASANLSARATTTTTANATAGQANPTHVPQHLNGYPNLYQPSSQLFQSYHAGATSTYGGLYQTSEAAGPQQQSSSFELWNQHYIQQQYNAFELQQQQQNQQQNAASGIATASSSFTTSAAAAGAAFITNNLQQQQQLNTSNILSSQHFAALAMQNEAHTTGNYGLTLPTSANIVSASTASTDNYMQNGTVTESSSNASTANYMQNGITTASSSAASTANYMQNGTSTAAAYQGQLPIKSEISGYPDCATASRGYNPSWNMQ